MDRNKHFSPLVNEDPVCQLTVTSYWDGENVELRLEPGTWLHGCGGGVWNSGSKEDWHILVSKVLW